MATRHKPAVRWRIGDFAIPTSRVLSARVRCGMRLDPYTPQPLLDASAGMLRLDNRDGAYNFIGGTIPTRLLTRPLPARRLEDGAVSWAGTALLDTAALAAGPETATWRLAGRSSTTLAGDVTIASARQAGQLTDIVAAALADSRAPAGIVDFAAAQRTVGPLLYTGTWISLLDICAHLLGGWIIERSDGVQAFVALDTARAAAPAAVLGDTAYERTDRHQGGALPAAVANEAIYQARIADFGAPGDIARQSHQVNAGEAITVEHQIPLSAESLAVSWGAPPVQWDDPAATSERLVLTDRAARITITPSRTGTLNVWFRGNIARLTDTWRIEDRGLTEPSYVASHAAYGLRRLPIPAWQANRVPEAELTAQRRYLRQLYVPQRLVLAEYSHQTSRARNTVLRDTAVPSRVVQLGAERILVGAVTISDHPTGHTTRLVAGIALDDIPAVDAVPSARRTGDSTMPVPVTTTGQRAVTDVLQQPPGTGDPTRGEGGCTMPGAVVVLMWPDAAGAASTYRIARVADRFRVGQVPGDGEAYFQTGGALVFSLTEEQAVCSSVDPAGGSIAIARNGVQSDTIEIAERRSRGRCFHAGSRSQGLLRTSTVFAVNDEVTLTTSAGGGTRLSLSTQPIVADPTAAPVRPGPIPAGAEIMIESSTLSVADMSALADTTATIRDVTIPFGRLLGSDALGDLGRRVFFAGPVPAGIACADFDLVDPPEPPDPPTAAIAPERVEIHAGASQDLRWAILGEHTVRSLTGRVEGTSVSVDVPLPDGSSSGTVTVTPTATTIYTLTASGPGGLSADTAVVSVTAGTLDAAPNPDPAAARAGFQLVASAPGGEGLFRTRWRIDASWWSGGGRLQVFVPLGTDRDETLLAADAVGLSQSWEGYLAGGGWRDIEVTCGVISDGGGGGSIRRQRVGDWPVDRLGRHISPIIGGAPD